LCPGGFVLTTDKQRLWFAKTLADFEINDIAALPPLFCYNSMFRFIGLCLGTLVRLLRTRRSLLLENLALRQQLAVLKRRGQD
jgi:hypothetical protein